MRQADVLGQVIIGAEPLAGDRIELAVPRGQENNRQIAGATAEIAAKFESALDVIL